MKFMLKNYNSDALFLQSEEIAVEFKTIASMIWSIVRRIKPFARH